MGILSAFWNRIRGKKEEEEEVVTVEDAILDVISATVLFDEQITENELEYAYSFVESALDVDKARAQELVDASLARVKELDTGAVIERVAKGLVTPEHRRMGFMAALAASKVDTEGWLNDGEEDFLHQLADALALDADAIHAIHVELQGIIAEEEAPAAVSGTSETQEAAASERGEDADVEADTAADAAAEPAADTKQAEEA